MNSNIEVTGKYPRWRQLQKEQQVSHEVTLERRCGKTDLSLSNLIEVSMLLIMCKNLISPYRRCFTMHYKT